MAASKGRVGNNDMGQRILAILRERSVPAAIDSIYQDVVKFTNSERTDQSANTYLMEFDMLREKAESRMVIGSGGPDEFAPVLCMRNAALPKDEKSPEWAKIRTTLASRGVSS